MGPLQGGAFAYKYINQHVVFLFVVGVLCAFVASASSSVARLAPDDADLVMYVAGPDVGRGGATCELTYMYVYMYIWNR